MVRAAKGSDSLARFPLLQILARCSDERPCVRARGSTRASLVRRENPGVYMIDEGACDVFVVSGNL